MATDRPRRRGRGSAVFALVSLLAGGLAGGVAMFALAPGPDQLYVAALGAGAGMILAVFGVVGALVGGWLVSAQTESLVLRALGVALGTGIVVGAAVASIGIAPPATALIIALVVVGLTISSVAPWRGGFARRRDAPTADPGVGA